jgi:hypothetical protein
MIASYIYLKEQAVTSLVLTLVLSLSLVLTLVLILRFDILTFKELVKHEEMLDEKDVRIANLESTVSSLKDQVSDLESKLQSAWKEKSMPIQISPTLSPT